MKNRIQCYLFISLGVFCSFSALAQAKPAKTAFLKPFDYSQKVDGYYLVYRDHYFGLLDSTGHQLVPCRYDDIDRFYEGMAEVSLKGKHGYVNQQGKLIIPLVYTRANQFQNGEALVVTTEGDIGYLNKEGEPVVPFNQVGRPYFIGRYARLWAWQPHIGRQNRESVGEALIALDETDTYVPEQLPATQAYRKKGLTLLFMGDQKHRRYGLADSAGHLVYPVFFQEANDTQYAWNGWIRVKKNDRYGFVDGRAGNITIAWQYEDTRPSAYNIIWVKKNGKWGCINRAGKTVVSFQYSDVSAYVEQRAIVRQGDLVGYVDTTGNVVVPVRFNQGSYYHLGKAKVYEGNHWLELDPQGTILNKGLQADVFWKWVKYGILVGGILFFVYYVQRHKISPVR